MNSNKKDLYMLIGIAFLVVAGVILLYTFNQPKVYYVNQGTSQIQTQENTTQLQVEYPINLNTATAEELMSIEGVGSKIAYSIIDYRDYIGGYSSVDQIMDISGIGENIYSRIAGYLTV